jgi:hypothetical protein
LRHKFILLGGIGVAVAAVLYVRLSTTSSEPHSIPKEEILSLEVTVARVQPMPVVLQSVGQVASQHIVQITKSAPLFN